MKPSGYTIKSIEEGVSRIIESVEIEKGKLLGKGAFGEVH